MTTGIKKTGIGEDVAVVDRFTSSKALVSSKAEALDSTQKCETVKSQPDLAGEFELDVTIADGELSPRSSSCPCCGGTLAKRAYGIPQAEVSIFVCIACQSGRLVPMPTPDTIKSYYPDSYYGDSGRKFKGITEWAVRLVGARQARFLASLVPARGRVLDIGCGRGVLLRSLLARGFTCDGFELSQQAASGLHSEVRLSIGATLEDAGYSNDSFDMVVLWHVLEHLPDPDRTLEEIRRILKPGGLLVVAVPNFSSWQARVTGRFWFHLDPPRHLHHFSRFGLRRLLTRGGFQPERECHFSLRQNPFGWLQSCLNMLGVLPRNALYSQLKRAGTKSREKCNSLGNVLSWLAYFAGSPVALLLAVLEAVFRQGGTISFIARVEKHGVLSPEDRRQC